MKGKQVSLARFEGGRKNYTNGGLTRRRPMVHSCDRDRVGCRSDACRHRAGLLPNHREGEQASDQKQDPNSELA
jgi:hypothetical protein